MLLLELLHTCVHVLVALLAIACSRVACVLAHAQEVLHARILNGGLAGKSFGMTLQACLLCSS